MVELPIEIVQMIQKIEDAGFEAYAVGGCVRDILLEKCPVDWDLTSNASRETLKDLFPDASLINKKLGVMRVVQGQVTADVAAFRIDGEYKDYRRPESVRFTQDINEDLKRRDFTMNAIAVNPARGVLDPFHGTEDIRSELIRGIGDPRVRFEEDALRILRAVRFAAQLGFRIEDETFQAMKEKVSLLEYISLERIREEFFKIMTARYSGAGLLLLLKAGILKYVLGEALIRKASESETECLITLAENIDRTECSLCLRLALIYQCFERNRALDAIEVPGYSNEIKKLLRLSVNEWGLFCQIEDSLSLKKLLNRIGTENFRFLIGLSAQRKQVFGLKNADPQKTIQLYDRICQKKEPVFMDELAVGGDELKEAGMKEGAQIGITLGFLLDAVHQDPEKNRKDILLQIAEAFNNA